MLLHNEALSVESFIDGKVMALQDIQKVEDVIVDITTSFVARDPRNHLILESM